MRTILLFVHTKVGKSETFASRCSVLDIWVLERVMCVCVCSRDVCLKRLVRLIIPMIGLKRLHYRNNFIHPISTMWRRHTNSDPA